MMRPPPTSPPFPPTTLSRSDRGRPKSNALANRRPLRKAPAPNRSKSVSPTRTLRLRRISRLALTLLRIILAAQGTTGRARITEGAVIAAADASDVAAAVIVATVSRAARADEIFLRPSMLRPKAANFVDTTIAVASSPVMTIAARKVRAVREHRPQISVKKPLSFPASPSQSTATKPQLLQPL